MYFYLRSVESKTTSLQKLTYLTKGLLNMSIKNSNAAPASSGIFGSFLINNIELIACVIGLIASILGIKSELGKPGVIDNFNYLIGIDILNITVIVIALCTIKANKLEIEGPEMEQLSSQLLVHPTDGEMINVRVNEIVRQLVYCVRWFAIILGFFYLLQLFADSTIIRDKEGINNTLKASTSIVDLIMDELPYKTQAVKYLIIETFTNASNLFSAAYLFLAFQVLFLVTVDKDNKTWRMKGWVPFSIAILIMLVNIVLFLNGYSAKAEPTDAEQGVTYLANISHMMRLTGGVYNGVAMFLLFSRFISMEYFFQNSSRTWQRNFYFYGTVIILPLYVIAQPMYGIFEAVEIGKSNIMFKSLVFLVCFWGKLVFFLFIFTMLTKKWIHAYIFISLTQKDTVSNVSKALNEVEDM